MTTLVLSRSMYKRTLCAETIAAQKEGKRKRTISTAEVPVIITASLHIQTLRERKRRSVLKVRLASF
jgi:hypothetical protein